jgi:hypothetical protein
MSEAWWQGCDNPLVMLQYLQDPLRVNRTKAGRRRLRLFACACCRRVWKLIPTGACQQAVTASESYADGLAGVTAAALADAQKAADRRVKRTRPHTPEGEAARAARWAADRNVVDAAKFAAWSARGAKGKRWSEEWRCQAVLLREIFGNPFHPIRIDQRWLEHDGGAALTLARELYDEGRFTRLPALADALAKAGCKDDEVLAHCRSRAGHVRGCWLLDAILGKE